MSCKQCGPAWAAGLSDEDIQGELARRKTCREEELVEQNLAANAAKESYLSGVWPTHDRAGWLWIVNILVAMIGAGIVAMFIDEYMRESFGAFGLPISLFIVFGAFLILVLPAIFMERKERRLVAQFKKEYPEHAKWL